MREQSAPELLRRTAELARQQPAMAFAGAILAGIAMSRFIKSSAARDGSGSGDGNRRRGATSGDYGRSREEDAHAYGPGVSGFGTAGTATPATGSGGETLGRADRRAEGSFAADKPTEMP
jgi:hypothetical protein